MKRRRKLLLFALLVLSLGAFLLSRVPRWSATLLADTLAAFFQRPVRIGAVRFHVFPVHTEILDLTVAGISPDAPPFLEVARADVVPSPDVFRGGPILLSRVRLEGLRVRVNAFPDPPLGPGGDDIPKLATGGGGGRQVKVGRLVIEKGEFILNHERVPLDLDLPEFHGRFDQRADGLAGHLSFRPGELRFGAAPSLQLGTEVDLRLHQGRITVEGGRLIAEGTSLGYTGQLRFGGRPQGQFNLEGPVDLAVIERHLMRSGLGLQGAARWNGVLSVDGSRLRIEGRMEGTEGAFLGFPVPRFAGTVAYDGNGVRIRGLDVESLGGSGHLDIDVPTGPPGTPGVRVAGRLDGTDAAALLRLVFGMQDPGIGSAATGTVDVRWPKAKARLATGSVALDLAAHPDGRTPLEGRVEWSALAGLQHVERAVLQTPAGQARLEGRVQADGQTDLGVDAQATDIAAIDDLLTRVRRTLGNAEAQKAGLSGAGSFTGRWRGTLDSPVFQGRFSGRSLGYRGVEWGQAEWTGTLDPDALESRTLLVRRAGSELSLEGKGELGFFGDKDAVDYRVRLTRWPAADLVKALDWDLDVAGALSGDATITGRRSDSRGSARLTAGPGRYFQVPFEEAVLSTRWSGHLAELALARVRVAGGMITVRGTVDDDGLYDGTAELVSVDVGPLVPASAGAAELTGRVSGRVTLQGSLARPRVTGGLTSPRLFVGDEGLGALEARISGDGSGRVAIDAHCVSPRLDLALTGTVGVVPPYDADLRLGAKETSLDPYVRVAFPALPAALGLVVSGEAQLRGPLASPRELQGEASLADVRVVMPEYPLRNQGDVRFRLDRGVMQLASLHLAGEGTDLALEGRASVAEDQELALHAEGAADLRALAALSPRLRGRGAARLSLTVGGTRATPRIDGTLAMEGAGLRLRGFPHGIDDVHGAVHFDDKTAELARITGNIGGGTVEIEGQARYAGGRLTSFDVQSTAREIGLRYPEGLRSQIDADLRFFGNADEPWITGSIDVRQALWSRRYDLASELLAASRPLLEASSLEQGARLDVTLRAPGTLRVDNNLATLQARAELDIQGTSTAPILVGRAEVERGRVYFQGRTYVIRQGTIDFVNPQKIDPSFDIEAETRVRSYRVTLRVNGTLERVTPTLTSDPPLSPVQILSLLAGAEESTVVGFTQAQAQAAQPQLAAAGAATLAAGRLSEEVGLERGAERLLGLNRFSIDPSLLRGAGTTPTARITLGKRITPDLSVLYSQDLRGTEQRILTVEYTLSDRLSVLLSREDPGGFGFDLRLRQTR